MLHLRISSDALLRCRFARSPLFETMLSLHVLADPWMGRYHLPWLDRSLKDLETLDLAPLLSLSPRSGFTPDFLSPPPRTSHPEIEAELAQVRDTAPGQVAAEIRRSLEQRREPAASGEAWRLLDDPAATRDRLVDLLEHLWERVVRPHWPRLVALLDADVEHRTRLQAQTGLARLLNGLDPRISYDDGELRIEQPTEELRDLHGDGLVLMPSAFCWPAVITFVDPPWQPMLVYPARGIAELWQPEPLPETSEALARLLGATRALLLLSLSEPASTRTLARRHSLAPATISAHLAVLANAGLATRRRQGREVLYGLTDLGAGLTTPPAEGRPR